MTDPILIDVPMPILTPHLLLRPVQTGDGGALNEAKRESWPDLARWGIWTWGKLEDLTVEQDEAFCRRRQAQFLLREKIMLLVFDREEGGLLGGAGLASGANNCDWEKRIFSVGYWTRTGQSGKGYATEVATALVRYAFGALAAKKVSTFHAEGNTGSQRVIEKAGFEPEGILRKQHGLPDGSMVDEIHYGLLDDRNVPPLDVRWGEDG